MTNEFKRVETLSSQGDFVTSIWYKPADTPPIFDLDGADFFLDKMGNIPAEVGFPVMLVVTKNGYVARAPHPSVAPIRSAGGLVDWCVVPDGFGVMRITSSAHVNTPAPGEVFSQFRNELESGAKATPYQRVK